MGVAYVGTAVWLRAAGFDGPAGTSDAATQSLLLRRTRDAIRTLVSAPVDSADSAATRTLNAVLAHGQRRRLLATTGPVEQIEVDDPPNLAAWRAADNFLELLAQDPSRIRRCAHPDCVLYFYDRSRTGRRMWCSMTGCGNRAKAARHYARTKNAAPAG